MMPDSAPFIVEWHAEPKAVVKEWGEKLSGTEEGPELARILRAILQRLKTNPLELGEVYRSRGAIQEHLAIKSIVSLDFSVDTQRKLVYVRKCVVSPRFNL